MSGHSKWATIKRKKALIDSKRSQHFTKLIKEISVAARARGGDPEGNPRLRTLLEKARAINMPTDNAMRAIKKGTGELPGVSYESQTYEGYGPNGIAVIVECLTDNRNRSVADLRHAFSVGGGSLGDTNSVSWMFKHMGVARIKADKVTEDDLLGLLLDYDIDSITIEDGIGTITTSIKSLEPVRKALVDAGYNVEDATIEWVPTTTTTLSAEQEERAMEFLEKVEDLEDVQNVYTNIA